MDLATLEGLEALVAALVPGMRLNIEHSGKLTPFCVVCVRKDPKTQAPLDGAHPVFVQFNLRDKDEVRAALEHVIARCDGVSLAFISEAWSVMSSTEGGCLDLSVSLATHPERQEVVMICCEHKDGGSATYQVPILRDGDKVSLGEPAKLQVTPMFGRFTGFFRHAQEIQA